VNRNSEMVGSLMNTSFSTSMMPAALYLHILGKGESHMCAASHLIRPEVHGSWVSQGEVSEGNEVAMRNNVVRKVWWL
jgi:hypothetical protein